MLNNYILKKLLYPLNLKRFLFFFFSDILIILVSLYLSFLLRFEWDLPPSYNLPLFVSIFIVVQLPFFFLFRFYSISWIFVGVHELVDIGKAITLSSMCTAIVVYVLNPYNIFTGFPRSIVFLDYILSIVLISLFRLSKRLYLHVINKSLESGKRTLIVGAGNAGEMIVRNMRHEVNCEYNPIGFVDDNEGKGKSYIQGVKVLGFNKDIPRIVDEFDVKTILIAIPSASAKEIQKIMSYIRESTIKDVKIIPGLGKIINGNVTISNIKEINIEDIIGREQVCVNCNDVEPLIKNKKVLITGAGGSIGSEIVRQVVNYDPEMVIALDIDETELFNIERDIRAYNHGVALISVIADICDSIKIDNIFKKFMPDIVLHSAAYKHVPIMEEYPEEAVRVNILGTMNVAKIGVKYKAEKFVMISTDKAVNPVNVMGVTKKVAEALIRSLSGNGSTKFISVRFGNVVGSRGSVIPIFHEQIIKGGPLTVTHKDMERYFMSIPEAVTLVLQAGAMGNGEVFMLDMGEPLKILDVAKEMIRLHGFEPDKDIPIVFTGIRKGEKLFEELLTSDETLKPTSHSKIFKSYNVLPSNGILSKVESLKKLIQNCDRENIIEKLREIVPDYRTGNGSS